MTGATIASTVFGASAAVAGTVGTIGTGIVGSVASSAINGAINGGGSSGGGGGGSGGGGSGGGLNITQSQYAYYGPHPSTTPLSNSQEPQPQKINPDLPINDRAGKAMAATGNEADRNTSPDAQPGKVPGEFQDVWASRLSRYLDYNTRGLG